MLLERKKVCTKTVIEKNEMVDKALSLVTETKSKFGTKYNLLANIVHDSPAEMETEGSMDPMTGGSYRIHINNKTDDQWYEIQDLHVQEILPQVIGLSESYMMFYEKKK